MANFNEKMKNLKNLVKKFPNFKKRANPGTVCNSARYYTQIFEPY